MVKEQCQQGEKGTRNASGTHHPSCSCLLHLRSLSADSATFPSLLLQQRGTMKKQEFTAPVEERYLAMETETDINLEKIL